LPVLYESITFSIPELSLTKLESNLEKFPYERLQFTRHIHFTAPFNTRLGYRCPHHDDPRFSDAAVINRLDGGDDTDDEEVCYSPLDVLIAII
jgi:hypothetical protein